MVNLGEIIKSKRPKVNTVLFIAVDGHSGSGKSTLAKWLSEKLGAELIHTDDFAGWDNPLNWWPNVVQEVFEPIRNGAISLSYQPASWWENHHPEPVVNQPVSPIMVIEGVGAGRSEFDNYISMRIFVDTPKDICIMRGVARDRSTGKSEDELLALWHQWSAAEDVYFLHDNPKDRADVVLDGTQPFIKQILLPEYPIGLK